ncbi:phospholipase D-like domain-containing protein [Streptacidiphilus jiangxiensis]|uniref:phospholipase D n=1 Tax=Streptacidiphilus jiangxiensis TaxID=235985 RepID=A0A1H7VXD3_STRJI|nr:phospholipase D-like domain-containing protein [Streptacidiphilus jiangxiensis]SEM13539.1 Phosphatidylserine/phosphatidylglycerophosphate/cardiolipin synthase [Streptacidiphilus jiangxiensis]
MSRKGIRRATVALAAGTALFAAALPAHAASYSAFAFNLGTTEPAIYTFINSATKTLDMTMYELSDTTAVNDLIAREKAGVTVRVVLDRKQTSTNGSAYTALKNAGVGVVYSSSSYVYTHQKTITVDGATSLILTGNLTAKYYPTSRDYGVFDNDANDVAAVEKVFNADYAHTAVTPGDGDNLLWSPTDARSRLLGVINGATRTLDVEEEEFSDPTIVNAIAARAAAGVTVRVVLETPGSYSSEVAQIDNAGGTVVGYSSSTGFYIHAKAIVADYGLATQKVEAGSMNITTNSLDNNRELGIILTNSGVASVVETAFASDYAGGTPA